MIDHDRNPIAVVDKCSCEKNIKLNAKKMKLILSEVPFIGHLLTAEGLKPDQNKVKAISEMPEPVDLKALQRFWAWSTTLPNSCLI